MNAHPKLPITQVKAVDITEPRLPGANSPQATKPAMRTAEPQKTAGSTPFRYRFIRPPESGSSLVPRLGATVPTTMVGRRGGCQSR